MSAAPPESIVKKTVKAFLSCIKGGICLWI